MDILRSSASPPSTPQRRQRRANIATFINHCRVTDTSYHMKIDYLFNKQRLEREDEIRRLQGRNWVQKGGLVYVGDVHRSVAWSPPCGSTWHNYMFYKMTFQERAYYLYFYGAVRPLLLISTAEFREQCNAGATATLARYTKREKKKQQELAKQASG